MRLGMLTQEEATNYLLQRGFPLNKASEHVGTFDWNEPVWVEHLWEGARLRQYMRRPWGGMVEGRTFDSALNLGDFFGLTSARESGLAIGSGVAGRVAVEFEVVRPIAVLAGTARDLQERFPADSIGGPGGATQYILSMTDKFALQPV